MSDEPSSSDRLRTRTSTRSRRWPGWVGLAALIALPVLSVLTVVVWVYGGTTEREGVAAVGREMRHVHGLGFNPADDAVYVATHSGVFRIVEGGPPSRVADRHQDTMGFTVAGPDRFLASGHPDLAEKSLPTHLGLIESTDAAVTWQERSLGGKADFHALDAAAGAVVAWDGLSGRLLSSPDGEQWSVVAARPVVDVAVDPVERGAVLVTTPEGVLLSYDAQGDSEVRENAPVVGFVDWPRADLLVAAGPDGQLHRSEDGGKTWGAVGDPLGAPQAIDVSDDAWLVATQGELLISTDEGETWETMVELAS
jgi:hypothetical protein